MRNARLNTTETLICGEFAALLCLMTKREEPDSNDIKNQKAPLSSAMSEFRSRLQVPAFATKYVDAATGRDWRGTLRSWEDFASAPVSNEQDGKQIPAFNLPDGSQVKNRVIRNISYFITNYVLVYATLAVYGIVSDFTNLIFAGLVGLLWYYVVSIFPTIENPPAINGKKIKQELLYKIAMFISIVVGFFLLGEIFNWVLTFGTIFCLVHAVFRVPSYNDRDRKSKTADEESALGTSNNLSEDADSL